MQENKSKRSKAELFVEKLLTEGDLIACDKSDESYNQNELPPYYDEKLFERGKLLYRRNILGIFFAKILGLLCLLSLKHVGKILIYTNKSSTNMTAYKRYLSTILHMCCWYEGDFTPGSKLWKSMFNVKNKHNVASQRSCNAGIKRFSQKDMALTQFGFMGIALVRSEMVGIHNKDNLDMYGFIHIWRVVGYLLGIQDRFNICRETVEETMEICEILIEKVFKVEVVKKDENFLKLSTHLINGLWVLNPYLQPNVFLAYLYQILYNPLERYNNQNFSNFVELNSFELKKFYIMIKAVYFMKYAIVRNFLNFTHLLSLWLTRTFPILAYYKYGFANSHIDIYQ